MPLILNDELLMLRDSARDFLRSRTPVGHLRRLRDEGSKEGFSRAVWGEMSALGWPAILVPEAYGGLGFGFTGLGVVLQEAGHTLTPSPLLSSALIGAALLSRAGTAEQQRELLPRIASGELLVTLAVDDTPQHRPERVLARAEPAASGYRLSGRKFAVIDGTAADRFIVSARRAQATVSTDSEGISLFLVRADAPGVTVHPRDALDIGRLGEVEFDAVELAPDELLGPEGRGLGPLDFALDAGRAGQAAELLGLAREAFDRTLAYLKERKQFGVPIGSFQALQHRAAQLYGELELCQSLVLDLLQALDAGRSDVPELASAAKAKLSEVAMNVTGEAIQMHGGIGMTDAFDIGFFYKRARVIETLLGDRHFHLDRYARLRGY